MTALYLSRSVSLIAILFTLTTAISVAAEIPTNHHWGASPSEIKQLESQPLLEEKPGLITYQSQLNQQSFHLEYVFDKQKGLTEKLYYHSLKTGEQHCSQHYQALKNYLQQQFGQPLKNHQTPSNCQQKAHSNWQLKQGERLQLKLDSWKGQPYIGLQILAPQ